MHLRVILASIMILAISPPIYPDQANSAYKRGVRAEGQKQYDAAFESYKQAYTLKPKDARYIAAYLRSRAYAAEEHVRSGQLLRDNSKFQESLAEFQRAVEIDSSNFAAQQELRRTAAMLRKQAQEPGGAAAKPEWKVFQPAIDKNTTAQHAKLAAGTLVTVAVFGRAIENLRPQLAN